MLIVCVPRSNCVTVPLRPKICDDGKESLILRYLPKRLGAPLRGGFKVSVNEPANTPSAVVDFGASIFVLLLHGDEGFPFAVLRLRGNKNTYCNGIVRVTLHVSRIRSSMRRVKEKLMTKATKEISAVEAARMLGVGLEYLYGLLWTSKINARKVENRWRVSLAAVESRLRTRKAEDA